MAKNQADKITETEIPALPEIPPVPEIPALPEIPEITEAEISAKTQFGLSRAQALEVLENQRAHDKALRL